MAKTLADRAKTRILQGQQNLKDLELCDFYCFNCYNCAISNSTGDSDTDCSVVFFGSIQRDGSVIDQIYIFQIIFSLSDRTKS